MESTITKEAALVGFTREGVEALSKAKGEPGWVLEARLKAWETYESLPMPKRTERLSATDTPWSTRSRATRSASACAPGSSTE